MDFMAGPDVVIYEKLNGLRPVKMQVAFHGGQYERRQGLSARHQIRTRTDVKSFDVLHQCCNGQPLHRDRWVKARLPC